MAYGKSPTKTGLTKVLNVVLENYKNASLPELNAVLKLDNIVADRGKEDGIIFKKNGFHIHNLIAIGSIPVEATQL